MKKHKRRIKLMRTQMPSKEGVTGWQTGSETDAGSKLMRMR